MESRRDLMVGLFVLTALGIVIGTLIVTSGLGDVRFDLYMRTESAQDLTRDTRVLLQGLEIGRVQQLNPVRTGPGGALSFVGKLAISQKFPDGTPVSLPRGSRALIAQTSPIAAPVVQIIVPKQAAHEPLLLAAGDTIESERRTSTMDQFGDVAQRVSVEVEAALTETRRLLAGTMQTIARTDSLLAVTTPAIRQVLGDLAGTLERTDRLMSTLEPRLPAMTDSITIAVAETRRLLEHLDQFAGNANTLATDNRETIRETLEHLRRSSILMEHFIDQVSRRPVRMLTGVRVPPAQADGVTP